MSPAAHACQGRTPYRRTEAQWPAHSAPRLCPHHRPGEATVSTEDLSPSPPLSPHPVPYNLSCCPVTPPSCEDGHGQAGCRALGPHLAVIRRGHIPLAHPVAIIGVGVVCISNPLLRRKHP